MADTEPSELPLPTAKRGERVRGEGLLLISTDDNSHWARGKSSSSPLTLSSIFQMEERELLLGPVRWSTLPWIADGVRCGSGAECVNRFFVISPPLKMEERVRGEEVLLRTSNNQR